MMWKLGCLTSPKTSLKQVFLVELSYINLGKSKLSATSSFGKNTNDFILGKNFIVR
jgi:hypothetical protein